MEKIYNNFNEFSSDYKYDEETDKLGEGGFASVYRADDMVRHREVAVKVSKVPKDERYSLKHEFEVVKSFPVHSNVAYYESCYRFKMPGVGLYDLAIMDYYPLGNLELFMSTEKIKPEQLFYLVNSILDGLAFLHENGAIHRDIKPSNILIAKFSNKLIPKIADFGLGKILGTEGESSIENSFIGGSVNYAAPEQILGTRIRPNVDLWSFGVLLYKICVGEVPFMVDESSTSTSIRRERLIKKIVNAEIPERLKEVDEPYQTIIRKCLVVDAEIRPKSAKELLKILNFDNEFNRANQLFESGNIESALKIYQDLLDVKSDNSPIEKRINEIAVSKEDTSILDEVNLHFNNKNYQAALETFKKLSNDETAKQAEKIKTINQWIALEIKAQNDFSKELFVPAKVAYEKLFADNPEKYQAILDETKKYVFGQENFTKAEELFKKKNFSDAYIIYSQIDYIAPSQKDTYLQHQEFSKKFCDLLNEAEKNKKDKKWDLAIKNYQELLKLDKRDDFEKSVRFCEAESNKTVIIKTEEAKPAPKASKNTEKPADNDATIIIKKAEKEVLAQVEKQKLTLEEVNHNLDAPTSQNKRLIYALVGVVVLVVGYFVFKPAEVKPVEKETVSLDLIKRLNGEIDTFFNNGEYDKYANLVLLMKEKYEVDSTVSKSELLARKLSDFEVFLQNNDQQGTDIAKKIAIQSLRLNPNNKTVLKYKEKYKF